MKKVFTQVYNELEVDRVADWLNKEIEKGRSKVVIIEVIDED